MSYSISSDAIVNEKIGNMSYSGGDDCKDYSLGLLTGLLIGVFAGGIVVGAIVTVSWAVNKMKSCTARKHETRQDRRKRRVASGSISTGKHLDKRSSSITSSFYDLIRDSDVTHVTSPERRANLSSSSIFSVILPSQPDNRVSRTSRQEAIYEELETPHIDHFIRNLDSRRNDRPRFTKTPAKLSANNKVDIGISGIPNSACLQTSRDSNFPTNTITQNKDESKEISFYDTIKPEEPIPPHLNHLGEQNSFTNSQNKIKYERVMSTIYDTIESVSPSTDVPNFDNNAFLVMGKADSGTSNINACTPNLPMSVFDVIDSPTTNNSGKSPGQCFVTDANITNRDDYTCVYDKVDSSTRDTYTSMCDIVDSEATSSNATNNTRIREAYIAVNDVVDSEVSHNMPCPLLSEQHQVECDQTVLVSSTQEHQYTKLTTNVAKQKPRHIKSLAAPTSHTYKNFSSTLIPLPTPL